MTAAQIRELAETYIAQDRSANGVCIYCKFRPCVCAPTTRMRDFRRQLRTLSYLERYVDITRQRRNMIR